METLKHIRTTIHCISRFIRNYELWTSNLCSTVDSSLLIALPHGITVGVLPYCISRRLSAHGLTALDSCVVVMVVGATNSRAGRLHEMEFVFGEAPPTSLVGSSENQPISQDSEITPIESIKNEFKLTHVSVKGEVQLVDVPRKDICKKVLIVSCRFIMWKKEFGFIINKTS
ncbi:hypothetical protein E3N88_36213 [Mikania micrantha]|uniref:Uncharacterized protein n=1 Tax=Mikania micrantha TaxID=192012 RepID=A0A5N6M5W7_9ASTR|nr:hypothetical protein E3N88_36213 [Mikania micrantha]